LNALVLPRPFIDTLIRPIQIAPVDPAIPVPDVSPTRPADCPPGDPCKGLREQLRAHEQKLRDYMSNQQAHDNRGILGGGRDEVIIAGRIRKLQGQIENFRKLLEECEFKNGFRT
jgi:hypothetical protein